MRVSFDLDEVLFVDPATHKTELPLRFPLNRIYTERLRLGTPELVKALQKLGYEVWVYTSSYRTEEYIRRLFRHYGVHFDGIITAQRHLREVQRDHKTILPQKMPNFYHISLHVDDEKAVHENGRRYGFRTMRIFEPDSNWVEKVLKEANRVLKLETREREEKKGDSQ